MTLVVSTLLGHVASRNSPGVGSFRCPSPGTRRHEGGCADQQSMEPTSRSGSTEASIWREGSVLDDDGERVLVISRVPEPALVVRFDLRLDPARLVEQAVAIGHAFGNQHAPVEVAGGEVRVPLLTSDAIARATVESLKLEGAVIDIKEVALGRLRPLSVSHSHSKGHAS